MNTHPAAQPHTHPVDEPRAAQGAPVCGDSKARR